MFTCPYCGSEVSIIQKGPEINNAECLFCEIILGPSSEYGMYAENGNRVPHYKQHYLITREHTKQPLSQLKQMHTIDLLLCLSIARKERSLSYNQLRIMNKGLKEIKNINSDMVDSVLKSSEEAAIEYKYWTRKCWVFENLLIERVGYFPETINELLYEKFVTKNKKSLQKKMTFKEK